MKIPNWLTLFLGFGCLPSATCRDVGMEESQSNYPYCFYEMSKYCTGRIDLGCLCLTDIGMSRFAQCVGKMKLEVSKAWEQLTYDCEMTTGSRVLWQEETFQKEAARTGPQSWTGALLRLQKT